MKLELKHLAGYLPYGLIISYDRTGKYKRELSIIIIDGKKVDLDESLRMCYLPILRPLSDLTKEIEVNGEKFVPFNRIDLSMYELKQLYSNLILPTKLEFWQVERLLEYHFDIHGLIEKGLAIDINNL